MKKLVYLISLITIILIVSCSNSKDKMPQRSDYMYQHTKGFLQGRVVWFTDLDKDGLVDAITPQERPYVPLLYVKGYESQLDIVNISKPMSSEIREKATAVMRASQSLDYQLDLEKYEENKNY